jgi:hypothetical protein
METVPVHPLNIRSAGKLVMPAGSSARWHTPVAELSHLTATRRSVQDAER